MNQKDYITRMTLYEAALLQVQGNRKLTVFFTDVLEEYNITKLEWICLEMVLANSKIALKDIARLADVEPPLVTRIIKRLEKIGYISTVKSQNDGRLKMVQPTPLYEQMHIEIETKMRSELKSYLKPIDRKELIAYLRFMKKLTKLP